MILHVDLDAFFASLEEARNPELKGKPVIICIFTKQGKSGAVATANYLARSYGIHSGMALSLAKQKLPDAVYLEADKEYYKEKSEKIMALLSEFGEMEQASIDEAYIEVDGNEEEIAEKIKHEIKKKFGLDASIGIGKNILLAKIASKLAKPSGIRRVSSIEEVKDKDILIVPGIGVKTAEKLNSLGIKTIGDLIDFVKTKKDIILENFGEKLSIFLFNVAHGKAREHVEEEISKSTIGKIITLDKETSELAEIESYARKVLSLLYDRIEKDSLFFDRVIVMFFFENYDVIQRMKSIPLSRKKEDLENAVSLIIRNSSSLFLNRKLRRIGVFVGIKELKNQSTLFDF